MNETVASGIQENFRRIFRNPNLFIEPGFTANDIPGWDSLTHMVLINEVEVFFSVSFTFEEVNALKNIGDIISLVQKKLN